MTVDSAAGDAVRWGRPAAAGIDVGVVAVSDTRTRGLLDRSRRSCWGAMEHYAALLEESTAMRAIPLPLNDRRPQAVADRVLDLPSRVAAVFVIGLDAVQSIMVQAVVAAARGPLVVAEIDVLTAGLSAAAVSTLRNRGRAPGRGSVVLVGGDAAPKLEPVLLASGTGSVTHWRDAGPGSLSLRQLVAGHDILVDLTDSPSSVASDRTVVVPPDPFECAALALPGLLSAHCGHGYPVLTVDALVAAARAIALLTTHSDRTLPDLHDERLVPAVARHVGRLLSLRSNGYPPAQIPQTIINPPNHGKGESLS
ncbi:hypothetical protein [Nocardia niigatensis]